MSQLPSKGRIGEMFESFPIFLTEQWRAIGLPDPAPLQLDVAWHIQHGPPAMQIQALRGAAKSWMTCAYVCWYLWKNPEAEVLLVSASGSTADNFAHLIKQWIRTTEHLKHMLPKDHQRDTQKEFDIGTRTKDGASASIRSKGITGMITGGRAHLIIGDDIETPDNSATVVQRLAIRKKVTEFEAILHPGGRIIYLGTPHHEDSVYGQLEADGYELRRWPAQFPDPSDPTAMSCISEWMRKQVEDNPDCIGHSTYPERFSDEDLQTRRLRMGESAYKLQYLLNRSQSNEERYPLKVRDLISYNFDYKQAPISFVKANGKDQARKDLDSVGFIGDMWFEPLEADELQLPFEDIVMAIDPSGSGADETAYVIGGFLAGRLYLLSSGGLQGGYHDDSLRALCDQAFEYRVNKVVLEKNLGGGVYTQLFRNTLFEYFKKKPHHSDRSPAMAPAIEDIWVSGQKEKRIIQVLEPLFNQHRIVVSDRVAKDSDLWFQTTHLNRDRGCLVHDDRVDALSLLATTLESQLNIDLDQLREKKKQDDMALMLKDFESNNRILPDGLPKVKKRKSWLKCR